MQSLIFLLSTSILVFFSACQNTSINEVPQVTPILTSLKTPDANRFADYWYQGKAEVTSYHLEQARYGEIHKGDAVLIFVTEDFSKKKQVKLDNPQANTSDAVKVMKLNFTKKFHTGVYPYSMMTSTFSPIDIEKLPHPLKITTSSQEWCGHTFMQLNLEQDHYRVQSHSYFESEGEETFKISKTFIEEELWNRIRLAPESLPEGTIDIIPSTMITQLKHTPFETQKATASKIENDGLVTYQLSYQQSNRKLSIVFEKAFPHRIESWEETYQSGWGSQAKTLTTKAVRNKSMLLDYWSKHDVADAHYRKKLGLE